jgi:predicted DNA-binding protein (UPF0251 family)
MAPLIRKSRHCRCFDGANYFKPRGIPLNSMQVNDLALDELEAAHLCDFEELEQDVAAKKMKISTSTLQRLLYSGRKKIIEALYNSKALKISKHDAITEYSIPTNNKTCQQQRKKSCTKKNIGSNNQYKQQKTS